MLSKLNERGDKKKILIVEIDEHQSRENSKSKVKKEYTESFEYGTDNKKSLNQSNKELDQMKEILSSCSNCRNKISQFVTKKTVHSSERWTQTTYKPFLIDLIEERVDEMYETNSRLSRMLVSREEEIEEKAQQMAQVEEKFTSVLLSLAQQLSFSKRTEIEGVELRKIVQTDSDTPSYIKALLLHRR